MQPYSVDQLRAFQDNSRRIQRGLLRLLIAGAVVVVAIGLAGAPGLALPLGALIAIIAGAGFWITRGHIDEFELQLRKLNARSRRSR